MPKLVPVDADPFLGKGIHAFHASPFDFDKFDFSHLGEGEGAQVYGRGGYFAQNQKVAEEYRRQFTPDQFLFTSPHTGNQMKQTTGSLRGSLSTIYDDPDAGKFGYRLATEYTADPKADLQTLIGRAQNKMKTVEKTDPLDDDMAQDIASRMQFPKPATMYEVNIKSKPDQFMDWDKPYSQMGDQAQLAMRKIWLNMGNKADSKTGDLMMKDGTPYDPIGRDFYGMLQDQASGMRGVMRAGGSLVRGRSPQSPEEVAANTLRDAGINGIKYLDQGSRYSGGAGTRNFVVFDDKMIDILKKFGMAGIIGAGGAHFLGGDQAEAKEGQDLPERADVGPGPAGKMAADIAGNVSGVTSARHALAGDMTEDEQKNFAIANMLGMVPGAGAGLAAMGGVRAIPAALRSSLGDLFSHMSVGEGLTRLADQPPVSPDLAEGGVNFAGGHGSGLLKLGADSGAAGERDVPLGATAKKPVPVAPPPNQPNLLETYFGALNAQ